MRLSKGEAVLEVAINTKDLGTLVGIAVAAVLLWMNNTLQSLQGTAHEQTAVLRKLESKVGQQNSRVDKLERYRDGEKGAKDAVERYGKWILAIMTLGVAVAAVVLSRVA